MLAKLHFCSLARGVVTAADLNLTSEVSVFNPDAIIANLNANGNLKMQLRVSKGRGYEPVTARQEQNPKEQQIGWLQLDASFSPVKTVSYTVENARVEKRTDLDRLIIDMETNGTIGPEESIRWAAAILSEQLSVFVDLKGEKKVCKSLQRELLISQHAYTHHNTLYIH